MKNWKMEMDLDPDLTESEKEKFLALIEKTDIPSIEEFAKGEPREDVQEAYWKKYGEQIADLRNQATEEEKSIKTLKPKKLNKIIGAGNRPTTKERLLWLTMDIRLCAKLKAELEPTKALTKLSNLKRV